MGRGISENNLLVYCFISFRANVCMVGDSYSVTYHTINPFLPVQLFLSTVVYTAKFKNTTKLADPPIRMCHIRIRMTI
jgi:hypothetical protein